MLQSKPVKKVDRGIESNFPFFNETEQKPYSSPFIIIAQFNQDSCVAACARMILSEFGIEQPESWLSAALETQGGALLSKLSKVLNEDFALPRRYEWRNDLTFEDLKRAAEKARAVVSVKRKGDDFGHALVIDRIINNEVRLRDPLPIGQGKSYAVAFDKFLEVWLRNEQTGMGVIYVE